MGLIVTIDRGLAQGSWLDLGMFMQAAFASYHTIIRRQLGIPEEQIVACGMALGHADPGEPANRLEASRVAVEAFARFHRGDGS